MLGVILAIAYSAVFIFLIRKLSFFQVEGISKNALTLAFIVKIIFGFIFWAVYATYSKYQNRADAFLYFDDGLAIYKALFEHPLDYFRILLGSSDPALDHYIQNTGHWNMVYIQGIYNETRTIIRFNAIADIFSFGNYHVHTIFICFLSLAGLTGIYKMLLPYLSSKKTELFIIIFFLPSVLFWGSGVLKEGLILFSMGMLLYYCNCILKEGFSIRKIILAILFTWLLAITKLYLLLILFPALISYAWILKTGNRKPEMKFIIVFAVCVIPAILIPNYNLPFKLMDKQRQNIYMANGGSLIGKPEENKFIYIKPEILNRIIYLKAKPGYCKIVSGVPYTSWYFDNFTDSAYVMHSADTSIYWIYYNLSKAGSVIDIPLLYPSYSSVLKNSPVAFLNTAFRPHLLEAKNPLMLMSALENSLIIAFILLCVFFYSKKIQHRHIIYFCFSIVILLFVLTGLTTPILGAAVRYKMPVLPFFLIPFLMILDKEIFLRGFPFLKRFIG
ncbi:MAG TPA: hypothetical protein VII99_12540 [Bacteroidia bacterium]